MPYFMHFGHMFFLSFLVVLICTTITGSNLTRPDGEEGSKVEVRAVFIDCATNEGQTVSSETEESRFQRQEQFKHNALRDCEKKLALTVKMANEPYHEPCDEYIAIDHVIEGSKKNRIRLLNPYILRLRREKPIEAYKLRHIEVVSGTLSELNEEKRKNDKRHRLSRNINNEENINRSFIKLKSLNNPILSTTIDVFSNTTAFKQPMCEQLNYESNHRQKRYDTYMNTPIVNVEDIALAPHSDLTYIPDDMNAMIAEDKDITKETAATIVDYTVNKHHENRNDAIDSSQSQGVLTEQDIKRVTKAVNIKENTIKPGSAQSVNFKKIDKAKKNKDFRKSKEKKLFLYEIKNADVWTDVHVQLFEKLITPDGNTAWNDLTGESFLVNSLLPEWNGDSISVRYRQAEWVPKEHFFLPTESLCLVVPQRDSEIKYSDESNSFDDHIVVPMEDIVDLENKNSAVKSNYNISELLEDEGSITESNLNRELRRVKVRVSRAIWVGAKEHYNITNHGDDKYLTLPHQRVYRSQLEVEARADDNQLVRVGASGRISMIVTDNSRKNRAIITVQATNTGLAAARFRITTRDCGPELEAVSNERSKHDIVGEPVVIPPMHSKRVHLEIPFEIPAESAQCTVALLNDGDDAVAIREVPIKKEDRCFCVWHCECVCLGDDPKLLCKDMSESRQVAAGLTPRDRSRRVRSACYKDNETINIAIVSLGVLYLLLLLGIIKAVLGICCRCFGWWGLDKIVQTPRRLDRYYESKLAGRTVRYDADGWPVHPDTGERSVRLISGLMQFILNTMFFLIWPFVSMYSMLVRSTCDSNCDERKCVELNATTKCFSSHDMQGTPPRWRKRRIMESRKWMTPEAEWLSEDIWSKGLGLYPGRHDDSYSKPSELQLSDIILPFITPEPEKTISHPWMSPQAEGVSGDIWLKIPKNANRDKAEIIEYQEMHPLLQDDFVQKSEAVGNSSPESDMDDTQYVVMQMQKSRDSLARSQKLINGSAAASISPGTPKGQLKDKATGK